MSAPTVATVLATLLRAAPDAEQDRFLVRSCAFGCGYAHVHYAPRDADHTALLRRPRCSPSRMYRIVVADVLPTGVVTRASA
jgi:hypothetical protein